MPAKSILRATFWLGKSTFHFPAFPGERSWSPLGAPKPTKMAPGTASNLSFRFSNDFSRIFYIFGNRSLSKAEFYPSIICTFTLRIRTVWTPFNMENDQRNVAHLFHFWYSLSFNSYVLSFSNLYFYPTNTHRMDAIQYGK